MHLTVNKFSRAVSKHFDFYFKPFSLATSYVELLMVIEEEGEVSQKIIAEELGLAPSTITRFINKLDKKGYINKTRSGKTMLISLDQKKSKQVKELKEIYYSAEKGLQNILSEKYTETTNKLLQFGTDQMRSDELK
jgi:DNA-binding MarR family transcriptional regulator